MRSGIYTIANQINGKVYVGSSNNLRGRWRTHLQRLRQGTHHSVKLQRAWFKYGEAAFVFAVIEPVEEENLLVREQYWLDTLAAVDRGYNICRTAGSTRGRVMPESQRQAVSMRFKGVPKAEETRQKMAAWQKGRPMYEAARIYMDKRGVVLSDEHKAKLSAATKGRPKSAEHRAKLSEAQRKRWAGSTHTEGARKKISEAKSGKKMSEEARARMREAWVKRKAKKKSPSGEGL